MRKYFTIFSTIVLAHFQYLYAQNIVRVTEIDRDTRSYLNLNNADINSNIKLNLDTNILFKKLGSFLPNNSLPSEVESTISFLNDIMIKKQSWLDDFELAVIAYEKGNRSDVQTFISNTQKIASEILLLLNSNTELKEYFESEEVPNFWQALTNALHKRILDLQAELMRSDKYSEFRIQLGGWLVTKNGASPLHFTGLDSNAVSDFYEVERWRFIPTQQELQEFAELQNLVRQDELRETNLAEIIRKRYVQAFKQEIVMKIDSWLDDFKASVTSYLDQNGISQLSEDAGTIISKAENFKILIENKLKFYLNSKTDPRFSFQYLVNNLSNDVEELNNTRIELYDLVKELSKKLTNSRSVLTQSGKDLSNIIKNNISRLAESFFGSEGLDLLKASSEISEISFEFTENVLSLSLSEFPTEANTDLRYSGFREPGDKVIIKLHLTSTNQKSISIQENHELTLYRILPHIETTLGIIFSNPMKQTAIAKEFQMAPYYNVLFKGIFGFGQNWKRKSSLANNLLDLTWGIHVSSPDFDKDDVPELGFGIAASTLRDYVQFGIAYNIFHGTPYWFFGLRLPLPNTNFSIRNTNEQAN